MKRVISEKDSIIQILQQKIIQLCGKMTSKRKKKNMYRSAERKFGAASACDDILDVHTIDASAKKGNIY
jgi:hypothetical protein